MGAIVVHGLSNCDTVKRSRVWLAETAPATVVKYHDFKQHGLPEDRLDAWIDAVGWEPLVNRRGTTWRGLDGPTRAGVVDATTAKRVLTANPSAIKRPVVEWSDGSVTVGFDEADWRRRLGC